MNPYRDAAGLGPNSLAIGYVVVGWPAAIWLLTVPGWGWNGIGVLLVAHTLVAAAYLLHEFAYHSIFRRGVVNDRFGQLMSWITGGCYGGYHAIRNKHIRHHADRVDVVTFDYREFLRRYPPVRQLVLALEWAWVPATDLLMHLFVIALPFFSPFPEQRARRGTVLLLLAVRGAAFGTLAWYAPKALLLYAAAWLMFLTVLRFNDCFQHTFPVLPLLGPAPPVGFERPTREYEQMHTWSNLWSPHWPWLNYLTLNFPYHNAHHARPNVPWYRLPALHAELYGDAHPQVIPLRQLWRSFHRNRVRRVMAEEYGSVGYGPGRADGFLGAVGVSFLTSV